MDQPEACRVAVRPFEIVQEAPQKIAPHRHALCRRALQTRTDFGKPGYGGPCPPEGHGPHRYQFTLFAVKQESLPVQADTSAAIVGFNLHFNTIEKVTLTGVFKR